MEEKKKKLRWKIINIALWAGSLIFSYYFYKDFWPYEIKTKHQFASKNLNKNIYEGFLADKKLTSVQFTYSSSGLFYESFSVETELTKAGEKSVVKSELTQKRWGGNKKVVVLLPTPGKNDPSPFLAWHIRNFPLPFWGYDTLRITQEREFLNPVSIEEAGTLADLERELKRLASVMKLRRANYLRLVSWLKKEMRYEKVGLVGISFGAIEGGFISASPDLDASVLIVGGADIVDIFLKSEEPFFKRWREELFKKYRTLNRDKNFKTGNFPPMIREIFSEVDSLPYALSADPEKILMMLSVKDVTVPFENGLRLWTALNQPCLRIYPTTHRGIITWYAPLVFWQSKNFLKSRF